MLADISTGDGVKIHPYFILGVKSDNMSLRDWHEERSSALDLTRWKWAISLLVDEPKRLHTQLGTWIAKPYHGWIWLYSMREVYIYRKEPTQLTSFAKGR